MATTIDIVEIVSNLLDSGKYKEALSIPNDDKYIEHFKDNCWDLVSTLIEKIQDDTLIIKPSLHGTCEEFLAIIVQRVAPEEALLEFIEKVEVAKNDAQFAIVLIPLQQLLLKLTAKRGRSLEWSLNSISSYIESIPISDHKLEGKELLLMDSDSNVRRVVKVYSLLPSFYSPFIEELKTAAATVRTKEIISTFLISLFGKTLIYIDLNNESNPNSESRFCCTTIVKDLCTTEKNLVKLLIHLEICYQETLKKNTKSFENYDVELSPYDNRDKINMTTLSGVCYVMFSGHFELPETAIPQVYSVEYLLHTSMLAVFHLLSFSEFSVLSKAVSLQRALLNRLPGQVSHTLLKSSIHFDVIKSLVNVAIYSSYEIIRKSSINLIRDHFNKFDYKGRWIITKYLLDSSNHSGMIGYSITLFKNSLNEAYNLNPLPESFTGSQLTSIVKKICHLPFGVESDLMELADQIIGALNFLRYLALKDVENRTGIRDQFMNIESDYLNTLRQAINLSKAHYEVKLRDINNGKGFEDDKVSVNVGGNKLDNIPTDQKKDIINSALNAFHLMEGLVARLSECIHTSSHSTMHCS